MARSLTATPGMLRDFAARWAILGVLALLYVAAAILSPDAFLEPAYLGNVLRQAAPVGIAAIGTTLVMILGAVDLSIGAIISLSAVFCAVQMGGDAANVGTALAATLLLAAALGGVNGLLNLASPGSSFILTLGSALALYGLTQLYSGGTARGIVAPGFREFFNARLGDVLPVLALSMLLIAAAMELVLRTTRFGRQIYLIGSNRDAARLAGLPVGGVTFACYVISGVFAGLGGTVFSGGRGTVIGTVAGTLVLFIAFNLVNILGFNYNLQLVLKGAIIILASAAYAWLRRER